MINSKKVRRLLKILAVISLLFFALVYTSFWVLLKATESHWLGEEPTHESIDINTTEIQKIALLDHGRDSLSQRLQLIATAKESIDLEFFIFELDKSARLITNALIEKSKEGVRVRLLVDFSFAVLKIKPHYAKWMKNNGIEIRYYNTSDLSRFFAVQHRTHRKLLIADRKRVILGGRNIGDDYFDLSSRYNFLDSDILVEGSIVDGITQSFDLYWGSNWTVNPEAVPQEEFVIPVSLSSKVEDDAFVQSILENRKNLVFHDCPQTRFVTDYPGSGVNHRKVYRSIVEYMSVAQDEIVVESPYFILRKDGVELIKSTVENKVKMKILTNSLASTDAYYTVAAMWPVLGQLPKQNFEVRAYQGQAPDKDMHDAEHDTLWGVHAKRAIIDNDIVLLGTYNIDPRSANLNSELMLVCNGSESLAQEMKLSFLKRYQESKAIMDQDGKHFENIIGKSDWKTTAMMIAITPLAMIFNFLL